MDSGGSVAGLGLSTAAVWGAADFAGGLTTKRAAPAFVVAVAHGFGLLLLYIAAFSLHAASSGYSLYGFLAGIFCGLGLIALYAALARGAMGLSAAVSGVLTAVFPVVYSWFQEGHPTPRRLAGFAIAALAIWLIAYTPDPKSPTQTSATTPENATARNNATVQRIVIPSEAEEPALFSLSPPPLALAVLAGLSFGAMLILMHLASSQGILGPLISMRIASASSAALAGLVFWLTSRRRFSTGHGFPKGKFFLLALIAGTLDTFGNLLYLIAAHSARLDVTAVLASLYPAGTMLLAAWLLKERATRSQLAGMVLALAAVALIAA
ncbi:MAG: EamA family transporter [Acidobacteriaceae bacterium]